ncbi:MAG TPA: chorismate synthase [Candidatus Omnitrophota bacterium]|jgi:chorismate synthase|nr:MAG: Chorismate synthase [Candidatus Omnitrophica bacterium ADurb.Bin314]HOE68220.1 chorismate synthase [Candidatus Omnitrophota bacterium]HPW64956.1 chorismate synthase [Candidatus Omnitrophota bacterium]HQB94690.1 chorismate synthase [Candidatus Omnitrophota bacterium]
MLNYITTGESHGKYLATILEGLPSGLAFDLDFVNAELRRRQGGFGRGGRQKIETDCVEIMGGVIRGKTTGAPLGLILKNRDNTVDALPDLERPRPGHADLAGALKYHQSIRAILERSSARETSMRVAAGAACKLFLREFGIEIASHVVRIGPASLPERSLTVKEIRALTKDSPVNCVCPKTARAMIRVIEKARKQSDTVGGKYEVRAAGLPAGLGSCVHHARKLDGRLAGMLMSKQSVKAVEIGEGDRLGSLYGSGAHDEIFYSKSRGYYHRTNRAGGIEGGMTNGEDVVVRVTMKPIATLARPLASVNMRTKRTEKADFERSDFCAVPAGSVIGEALVAYVLADAFLEKFGGDSMREIRRNYDGYRRQIRG